MAAPPRFLLLADPRPRSASLEKDEERFEFVHVRSRGFL